MNPKVSVCMITYNHEKFIGQAIESVILQKTDFKVELVIGEDCSTDTTRAICLQYKQKYPDLIRLLLPEKNIGVMPNLVKTLSACEGTYIAMLEGDDYWIDENKLQKQVNFLDSNPDYAVCFHNMKVKYDDGTESHSSNTNQQITTTISDLCRRNYIYTASSIFRNFHHYPAWLQKTMPGDWPLFVLAARQGHIYFINEIMGVYRMHAGGTWNPQKRHLFNKKYLRTVNLVNKALNFEFSKILQRHMLSIQKEIIKRYLRDHNLKAAKRYVNLFVKQSPCSNSYTGPVLKFSLITSLNLFYPFLKIKG